VSHPNSSDSSPEEKYITELDRDPLKKVKTEPLSASLRNAPRKVDLFDADPEPSPIQEGGR
jgi:hypothetical protein